MKPRPVTFSALLQTNKMALSLQCRREFHYQATAVPFLSTQLWHNRLRSPVHRLAQAKLIALRHASSAAPALKPVPAKSPSSNVPVPQVRAKLNPPPETHAPDLQVPARKSGQSYFKYLFSAGRAYINFYKSGISNVRATARLAKTLRQKKAAPGNGEAALTRAEWQVIRRSRRDMARLPAFGALVLLLGEWLPLIALYITPLIPEPCRIPAQINRKLQKTEARRQERERRLAIDAARLVAKDRKPGTTNPGVVRPQTVKIEEVENMDLYTLLSVSTRLDSHSWLWDKLFMAPPKPLLRRSVARKLAYLQQDDTLIQRDGGWQGLESKELKRACVERGIKVLRRSEADRRRELAVWFNR